MEMLHIIYMQEASGQPHIEHSKRSTPPPPPEIEKQNKN